MKQYKPVTITVHAELLEKFREHCRETKLPLSRFLSLCAMEAIKKSSGNSSVPNPQNPHQIVVG